MKLISKIIRLPLQLIPQNTILPILFGENKGFYWIKGSGVNSMWLGIYEKEKQKAISKLVKPGMICYDIGAHVGFYSLLFSKLIGNNGYIYAFEPLLRNVELLKKHLKINTIKNVKIITALVSEKLGYTKFDNSNDSFTGKISNKGIKIKTISIDEEINNKNISPPNIVKIDVEGHELFVLNGMKKTLILYKPILFIALDNKKTKKNVFIFLNDLGYKIYDLSFKEIKNLDKINEIVAKI